MKLTRALIDDETVMSIWRGIDRKQFELNLADLSNVGKSQRPSHQRAPPSTSLDGDRDQTLSLNTERCVADDIAFLATWDCAEGGVTAATLQESTDNSTCTVSLAANEGVKAEVMETVNQVLRSLESCAGRCMSAPMR